MDTDEFRKLSLDEKHSEVKANGRYIASRVYASYKIHLYLLNKMYVEVWMKLGLNHIYWIEVVTSDNILENYAPDIDVNSILNDKN